MSQNVDLNALRARIIGNQDSDDTRPSAREKAVVVDSEGRITLGDQPGRRNGPETFIPQETFADSVKNDRAIVERYMPSNTREFRADEGVTGFVYSFYTELADRFTLFAFFDGANYQVQVVAPEIEDYFKDPHTGHLFSDGRICFGASYSCGMPTLRDAYAKSVLWANGMSVALKTGQFPFSNNNL
jgi:hypothetical protein